MSRTLCTRSPRTRHRSGTVAAAAASIGMLLMTGCAGGIGTDETAASAEGFDVDASQESVDDALADLEPVTLTYQPAGSSPDVPGARSGHAFKEAVEQRSGGKITLDMVWGRAIAGYGEVDDALRDGRVDLSYTVPIYDPAAYPTVDAYSKVSQYTPAGTVIGEAVSLATMIDAAWSDSRLLDEFEEKGLTPLTPLASTGDYWVACNEEHSVPTDWSGSQLRVGGSVQIPVAESMGASATSMEYAEAFEALQRNTVDCTFIQPYVAASTGILEAAPHASVFSDDRMTGTATGAHVAGAGFQDLPLPYRQILFDAEADHLHGQLLGILESTALSVEATKEHDGSLKTFDPDVEGAMADAQEEVVDGLIEEGLLDQAVRTQLRDSAAEWETVVEELGYSDGGNLRDMDEWFDDEGVDFRPLTRRILADSALEHRPG